MFDKSLQLNYLQMFKSIKCFGFSGSKIFNLNVNILSEASCKWAVNAEAS